MINFKKAKWIWENFNNSSDEYVKFVDYIEYDNSTCEINISCDSNYIMYINKKLVSYSQYPDYPNYKVYNCVDITKELKKGKNKIEIIVWYYGIDSLTYKISNPKLIFEVVNNNKVILYSSKETKCGICKDYVSYQNKNLTWQLGLSYKYDTREINQEIYHNAVEVVGENILYIRPVKNMQLLDTACAKLIDEDKQIYDLCEEKVGFLHIKFKAKKGEIITISYAEHIDSGDVVSQLSGRDFSIELIANGGFFEFLGAFRRLGCRYLKVTAQSKVEINFLGIKECVYPLNILPFVAKNKLEQQIYDTCIRTLKLCMHEHYEDCPWREQALYSMDSRNQMLCGYYAFKEYKFPRANLLLMSKAQKKDKLLPLCFPAGKDVPIPFFSLIYIISMKEYAYYSKDYSLIQENYNLLCEIVNVFCDKIDTNNLIPKFEGYWNFYEWSEGMNGRENGFMINPNYIKDYDLPLNCFVILALLNLIEISKMLNIPESYNKIIVKLREAVFKNFYVREKGLFKSFLNKKEHYSKLSNSLAILTDCCFGNEKKICENMLKDKKIIETTLSMKVFEYDALIKIDNKYMSYIIDEINLKYKKMLDNNATTFWETENGAKDFDGAGSLCHGWSAVPIYYYFKNLDIKY